MKPILFNTDMVRAILGDRKTVTRRVIKFPKEMTGRLPENGAKDHIFYPGGIKRPPYQIGDILYVRETFFEYNGRYEYRADDKHLRLNELIGGKEFFKWRPSIHMPKEAARIYLRVTDVRVERLQDLSNEDVVREGVRPKWYKPYLTDGKRSIPTYGRDQLGRPYCCVSHDEGCLDDPCQNRDAYERECHQMPFSEVWNSTVKPADRDRYGWNANPYVWVIEFERISKEEAMKHD